MVPRIRRGIFATFLLINLFGRVFLELDRSKAFTDESVVFADALVKGLKYLKNRSEALTSDATLGVLVVRANLQWIYKKLHHSNSLAKKLESLIKQCNDIINLNKTEYHPILRESVWNSEGGDLKWGNFSVEDYKFLLPKFNSCENIDSYIMEGTPEDSDFCINELITSECEVSENCWFSETNELRHSGYKTTHRLLYFLIATQLRCERKNASKFLRIKELKHNLCQRMLSEAKALFEEPHFALTRDLFLEDIALCGLEGYQEFAPRVWRKVVRSWQNSEGCFGYDVDFRHCQINTSQEVDGKSKIKRTNAAVDGCHSHLTAVALSSLAFFLRCAVKETFTLL